eukprot:COSAG02_NODE_1792_length_10916_cov_169.572789_8_plen_130_part_00
MRKDREPRKTTEWTQRWTTRKKATPVDRCKGRYKVDALTDRDREPHRTHNADGWKDAEKERQTDSQADRNQRWLDKAQPKHTGQTHRKPDGQADQTDKPPKWTSDMALTACDPICRPFAPPAARFSVYF